VPSTKRVSFILGFLVIFDAILSTWAFAFPELWLRFWHDADFSDPQGFLRRCGANWVGFFVLQVIAFKRWQREPMWLAVVAGCRLGDAITDVTTLVFAQHSSVFAWVLFPMGGAGNVVVGVYLISAFRRFASRTTTAA
jgi:hypothetical protein